MRNQITALLAAVALLSCAKKPAPVLVAPPPGVDLPEFRAPKQEKPLVLEPKEKAWSRTVHFAFNSAEVRDRKVVGEAIFHVRNGKILLVGHACQLGSDEYNLDLSRRRAEAVKAAIVEWYSWPPSRIRVEFRGESEPLTHDEVEYWKNRRVEIFTEE